MGELEDRVVVHGMTLTNALLAVVVIQLAMLVSRNRPLGRLRWQARLQYAWRDMKRRLPS